MAKQTTGIPPETGTEEWRVLSAQVAYTLWKAERRASGNTDPKADAEAWKIASTEYRALVRYVLRELEKGGIQLRNIGPEAAAKPKSEVWKTKTARAAWLFWMNARRKIFPASEYLEAEAWTHAAADQRILVRAVFDELAEAGIRIVA